MVTSAAEDETNGIFQNANTALALRHLLIAISMSHRQTPTTISTENSKNTVFVDKNIQMKCSKSWGMNFHWLRDKKTLHSKKENIIFILHY